jgi:hypothetical protein
MVCDVLGEVRDIDPTTIPPVFVNVSLKPATPVPLTCPVNWANASARSDGAPETLYVKLTSEEMLVPSAVDV